MNRSTTSKRTMVGLVTVLQGVAIATTIGLTLTEPALALSPSQFSTTQPLGLVGKPNPPPLPPPPPESVPKAPILASHWKTQSEVMLAYLDVSLVETGFDMEQRRPGGPWQVIDTLDPLSGKFVSRSHRVSGLEPRTDYCFRVVAFNALGDAPSNEVCVHTTYAGACEEAKLEEVLALATGPGDSVEIDCDLYLEPQQIVTKRLVFVGRRASGVTVDLNGSTLQGGEGTQNDGRDMIEVRSEEVVVRDVENAISSYERPSNITIRNGRVDGSIRLWGMARNGEGDGEKKTVCDYSPPPRCYEIVCDDSSGCYEQETVCADSTGCYEMEVLATNQLKKSSRLPGHTARVQGNAPTGIVLQRLTIIGSGRSPVYFAPGVTSSKLIDSHVLGYSNAVGIYLDAESAGNTFKGNVIDVATKNYPFENWDRPLVAIDGSARNRFLNNWFSSLNHGGIYFYRNCGENGVIRHQTPSQNELINNIFYYNKYDGDNPAVFVGSRNRGGWFQDTFGFCEHDAGYPYGSSVADEDYARYNAIMQNQIYKRSIADMIKTNNPTLNAPNYSVGNVTVTESTVDMTRSAGCYNGNGNAGFMEDGDAFTKTTDPSGCRGTDYTCDDGELVAHSFSRCASVSTASRPTVSLSLR